MPITQERLRQVLAAGENYQFHYENLKTTLHQQARRAANKEITPAEALQNAIIQSGGVNLADCQTLLAQERIHYRLTSAKNNSDRKRLASKDRNRTRAPVANITPRETPRIRTIAEIAAEGNADEAAFLAQPVDDNRGLFGAPSFKQPRPTPAEPLSEERRREIDREREEMFGKFSKEAKEKDYFTRNPDSPGAAEWRTRNGMKE